MPEYSIASTAEEYKKAAVLFTAYAAWLNIDLGFQHFEQELATLDTMYAPPTGSIILCRDGHDYIACVAIRKITDDTAELKRMFVETIHQHKGIGYQLMKRSIELAREFGYRKIRLDTLSHMTPAINLYRKFGFRETPAYYPNPNPTALYFELEL